MSTKQGIKYLLDTAKAKYNGDCAIVSFGGWPTAFIGILPSWSKLYTETGQLNPALIKVDCNGDLKKFQAVFAGVRAGLMPELGYLNMSE
jgi:hypothetical protein